MLEKDQGKDDFMYNFINKNHMNKNDIKYCLNLWPRYNYQRYRKILLFQTQEEDTNYWKIANNYTSINKNDKEILQEIHRKLGQNKGWDDETFFRNKLFNNLTDNYDKDDDINIRNWSSLEIYTKKYRYYLKLPNDKKTTALMLDGITEAINSYLPDMTEGYITYCFTKISVIYDGNLVEITPKNMEKYFPLKQMREEEESEESTYQEEENMEHIKEVEKNASNIFMFHIVLDFVGGALTVLFFVFVLFFMFKKVALQFKIIYLLGFVTSLYNFVIAYPVFLYYVLYKPTDNKFIDLVQKVDKINRVIYLTVYLITAFHILYLVVYKDKDNKKYKKSVMK
jgi:hypothetical protein